MRDINQSDGTRPLTRRTFLTGAAAGGLALAKPSIAFAAGANGKIELGLIGCGGRGNWIAKLFAETGLYQFVACADYFQDRVDRTGAQFGIGADRRYSGLSGYKNLLESKLDAVVIESPPYFHPEQTAAAVDAGKHVFVANPIAVDVPGCLSIGESGRRATEKKLVVLVDFQTRANEHYREALRRVHKGDIGKLVLVEAHYPWSGGGREAPVPAGEERLRRWYNVAELSGDFIVEQSIHSLDVATWMINADPVRAVGAGGRKVRAEGSIWDHFAITYHFPDDLLLSFTCVQTIPGVRDEIPARAFGSSGMIHTDYFGDVWIRGKPSYRGGSTGVLYTTGAQQNIREFHRVISEGHYANETVAPSVRSNLTAVLGREAGYRGGEVTFEALLKEGKQLVPDLGGVGG